MGEIAKRRLVGKRVEIIQLLRDYNNFLPGGSGEAYVPLGAGGGDYGGWPLSPEALKRMDSDSLIGETYMLLNKALDRLRKIRPLWWETIYRAYLQDDTGHSQVDRWREIAYSDGVSMYSAHCRQLVERHDEAIEFLYQQLKDEDLWVKFANKSPGPKPGTKMEDRHLELVVVYQRYRSEGMSVSNSIKNAALKCDYSERSAWRIIRERIPQENR